MGLDLRVYLFTKRQRFLLAVIFTILCMVQISLGILTTGWSIYICTAVAPKLHTERTEITFVFTVTGIFGTHIIIHYLVGIKMCEKCVYKAHKKSTRRILLFWCLAGCNTILNIIILAIISTKISKHIAKSMRHSIEKGMQSYLTAPVWKHLIDTWQFTFQCCGVNDYKDWHDLTWLDKYHIDITASTVQEMRLAQDRFHFPVTPWSCCRTDFPMQCLHDPFQQMQSAYLWKEQPKLVLESINTKGCLDKLRAPIRWSLTIFSLICMTLVFLQTMVIIIARLLYTSSKNSIILRDPDGEAPGYVLTRGCIGQAKKTVSEIVLDLKSKKKPPKPDKACSFKKLASPKKIIGKLKKKRLETRNDHNKNGHRKNEHHKGEHHKSPKSGKKSPQKHKTSTNKTSQETYDSNEEPISTEDEEALMLR